MRVYRDKVVIQEGVRTPEFNGFWCSRTIGLRAGLMARARPHGETSSGEHRRTG
jgi:hypothetical protein